MPTILFVDGQIELWENYSLDAILQSCSVYNIFVTDSAFIGDKTRVICIEVSYCSESGVAGSVLLFMQQLNRSIMAEQGNAEKLQKYQ